MNTKQLEMQHPLPLPCPHPEYIGRWDYLGDEYLVLWSFNNLFKAINIHNPKDVIEPWVYGEFWKPLGVNHKDVIPIEKKGSSNEENK